MNDMSVKLGNWLEVGKSRKRKDGERSGWKGMSMIKVFIHVYEKNI
jgi:hypothetical protein